MRQKAEATSKESRDRGEPMTAAPFITCTTLKESDERAEGGQPDTGISLFEMDSVE